MKRNSNGKEKKYWWLINNDREKAVNIINYSKCNGMYYLPFEQLVYNYDNCLKMEDIYLNGKYKRFYSYSKGYSKNFIEDDPFIISIEKFIVKEKSIEKQYKGGSFSQKLLNNHVYVEEIEKMYPFDVDTKTKIHMFLNGEKKPHNCEICGKYVKYRMKSKRFNRTCSSSCKNKLSLTYKTKELVMPSGKKISVQGYEKETIELLMTEYDESELLIGLDIIKETGDFNYIMDGKCRKYFPDIMIIPTKTIVEVKSSYTYSLDKEKNELKKNSVLSKGLNFIFYIHDKNRKIQFKNPSYI